MRFSCQAGNQSEINMVKRQALSLYEEDSKRLMHPEESLLLKPFYLMPF